jgi:hypothetical protein
LAVRRDQQIFQRGRLMHLASGQVEAQRETIAIAKNVDLRGKTPARSA